MGELRAAYRRLTSEKLEDFAAVASRLPTHYQSAIKGYLAGKTQAQVALDLGVSQPRVSKMLKRGLQVVEQVMSQ